MALEKQIEEYKTRGASQLQKIEQATRTQPVTNAATGAQVQGGPDVDRNYSEAELAALSDDDLNALLGIK